MINTPAAILKILFVATLTSAMVFESACAAQDVDPEAYQRAKDEATRTFFDANATKEERLQAAEKFGYPEEATFTRMLELGADKEVEDEIRWEALHRHHYSLEWIKIVLKILDDPTDGGEQLNADLVTILSQRTVVVLPAPTRQAIQRSLRGRLDDPRDLLRRRVYFALVTTEDTVAITKLVDGLKDGGDGSPVPLASAIEMLDIAGATRHFNTLRPYLNHLDPEVQAQAARVLAADSNSRPAIATLIADKQTPESVRVAGLRGMSRFDERLPGYAIRLIQDPGETLAVREAAIRAVAARVNYKIVEDTDQIRFVEALEAFMAEPALEALDGGVSQKRASKVLEYLQKSSPTIRRYFQSKR